VGGWAVWVGGRCGWVRVGAGCCGSLRIVEAAVLCCLPGPCSLRRPTARLPLSLPQAIFAGSRTALAGIDILRKVVAASACLAFRPWPIALSNHTGGCESAGLHCAGGLGPAMPARFYHSPLQICNHPDLLERAKWEAAEVCNKRNGAAACWRCNMAGTLSRRAGSCGSICGMSFPPPPSLPHTGLWQPGAQRQDAGAGQGAAPLARAGPQVSAADTGQGFACKHLQTLHSVQSPPAGLNHHPWYPAPSLTTAPSRPPPQGAGVHADAADAGHCGEARTGAGGRGMVHGAAVRCKRRRGAMCVDYPTQWGSA